MDEGGASMRKWVGALAVCASAAWWTAAGRAQAVDPLTAQLRQGLTPVEVQQVLDLHNAARAAVKDAAPALVPVTWNVTLAAQAQAYADKLAAGTATGHDATRQKGWNVGVGENLAGFYADRFGTVAQLEQAWLDEGVNNFTYAPFPQSNKVTKRADGSVIAEGSGHYLAMVWDWTRQIGCGASSNISTENGPPQVHRILVCRYVRGGNMTGAYPWYTAANPPPATIDPIVAAQWTSQADLMAQRSAAASPAQLPGVMLAFANGYRTPATKLTWDDSLATGAAADAVTRAARPLASVGDKPIWGDLVSNVADDSDYPQMYPHVAEGFAKTVGWNGWMAGSMADAQFTRVGCGTTTQDWDGRRYRLTVCRFAK